MRVRTNFFRTLLEMLKVWPRSGVHSRRRASCGCGVANSAAGVVGAAFIKALARTTGADVAAATGRIGTPVCGGNWELATFAHRSPARPPITAAATTSYTGIFATTINTGTTAPTTVSISGDFVDVSGNEVYIWEQTAPGTPTGSNSILLGITFTTPPNSDPLFLWTKTATILLGPLFLAD